MSHQREPELPENVVAFPGLDPEELARRLLAGGNDPRELVASLLDVAPAIELPSRPRPRLLPRRRRPVTFRVRVDLDGATPPVWRRLLLASDLTLAELHEVLQPALGWSDSHLHQFRMGPDRKDYQMVPFATDLEDAFEDDLDESDKHEADVRLDEVVAEEGHRLFYEYDFGDGWEHTLRVEAVEEYVDGAPRARCIGGRRACPPEDIGGIHTFNDVASAMSGKEPEEAWIHEILDWLPGDYDPAGFDADEADEAIGAFLRGETVSGLPLPLLDPGLAAVVSLLDPDTEGWVASVLAAVDLVGEPDVPADLAAEITAPWRMLLDTVDEDGVKLTQAGYLPPVLVERLLGGLGFDRSWIGNGNREDLTFPVYELRESGTQLGLLRKRHGRLAPTAAGRRLAGDPTGLLRHIASRLPLGRGDHRQHAGWAILLSAAAGEEDGGVRASRFLAGIGWRVGYDGPPPHAASRWAADTAAVLQLAGWNPGPHSLYPHRPEASILARLALRR